MTNFLLDPLDQDQIKQLQVSIKKYPKEYKKLVKRFGKEARAYRDQSPTYYSIDSYFSNDPYILSTNWYYEKLSVLDVEKFFETI